MKVGSKSGLSVEIKTYIPLRKDSTHQLIHKLMDDTINESSSFPRKKVPLGNIGKKNPLIKFDMISVEESSKLIHQNPSSSSSSSTTCLFPGDSNFSNKKTVDDVWKEIVQNQQINDNRTTQIDGQGDTTTLEEFLVQSGVINHHPNPMAVICQDEQTDWLQFQMAEEQTISDCIYGNPVAITAMPMASSAVSEKKYRYSNEIKEKTIERRQKRMIKNRESAARSRARKQAYTNQLEDRVFQLKKTNTKLKHQHQQQQEAEMQLSSSNPLPMPRYQLRRTSSAPH